MPSWCWRSLCSWPVLIFQQTILCRFPHDNFIFIGSLVTVRSVGRFIETGPAVSIHDKRRRHSSPSISPGSLPRCCAAPGSFSPARSPIAIRPHALPITFSGDFATSFYRFAGYRVPPCSWSLQPCLSSRFLLWIFPRLGCPNPRCPRPSVDLALASSGPPLPLVPSVALAMTLALYCPNHHSLWPSLALALISRSPCKLEPSLALVPS